MTDYSIDELITATYVATDADGKSNSYYAIVLSKCKKYASTEVPTMGVCFDKRGKLVLLYNPDFLKKLTDGEAVAVLKHEAMHIFFRHISRFERKKNQTRVNVACDMAINQYLRGLPKGAQYPETYGLPRDLSADAYLKALEEQNAFDDSKMQMSGGGGQGQQGQGQQGQGQGDSDGDGDQQNQQGQGGGKSGQKKGKDKNQNQNQGQGGGDTVDDHTSWNKVVDENGHIVSDTEKEGIDTQSTVDRIARNIAQQMKSRGDAPAWAKGELTSLEEKSVHNWRQELKVLVQSVLSTDKRRSQKRINRKLACVTTDFLFPGRKKDRKPSVLLVRDTSGSMFCEKTQAEVLKEMVAISKHAEVLVCDCDTVVHQVYTVRKDSDFKTYQGGGGTSFVAPFEEAKKRNVDAVIYLTDLYGEFPDPRDIGKYARNTVWVTVEDDADRNDPPFGKVVRIPDEK